MNVDNSASEKIIRECVCTIRKAKSLWNLFQQTLKVISFHQEKVGAFKAKWFLKTSRKELKS